MSGNITIENTFDARRRSIVVVTTVSEDPAFKASQVSLTPAEAEQMGDQLKVCARLAMESLGATQKHCCVELNCEGEDSAGVCLCAKCQWDRL